MTGDWLITMGILHVSGLFFYKWERRVWIVNPHCQKQLSAYNRFPFELYQFVFIKDLISIDKILNLSVHVLYK